MTESIPHYVPTQADTTADLLRKILAELRVMRQELTLSRVALPASRPSTTPLPINKLLNQDDQEGTFIVEEK